jgi:Flp pilus assembly protein CpaB
MGRLRGFLWLFAGLVVAATAGMVGFVTLSRAAARTAEVSRPEVPVVVAAHFAPLRSTLSEKDLGVKQVPVDAVPEGAVSDIAEVAGKVTLVDLYVGEAILAQRLVDPNVVSGDGRLSLLIGEDEVLMAFPAQDLMSRSRVLKAGDRVDLLISLEFPGDRGLEVVTSLRPATGESKVEETASVGQEEELATFAVLENVGIAAVVGGEESSAESKGTLGVTAAGARSPEAILLTLSSQDALVLKYAMDSGGIQDIVLRAPGADRPFAMVPVDVDYVIDRYQIPTAAGQ